MYCWGLLGRLDESNYMHLYCASSPLLLASGFFLAVVRLKGTYGLMVRMCGWEWYRHGVLCTVRVYCVWY